jgi:hypothetical protein
LFKKWGQGLGSAPSLSDKNVPFLTNDLMPRVQS